MPEMTHSSDSFISKLDPAEMRVRELATKSRKKHPNSDPKRNKKHNEEQGKSGRTLKKDKFRFQNEKREREWAEKNSEEIMAEKLHI